jgi:Fic family protein
MTDTDISYNLKLFNRIDRKKANLDTRRPLPKDSVNRLREEIRLRHTYHSNAIEGNSLTLQETKVVIEEGITIGGKSLSEHLEATGNARGYDSIEELARSSKPLNQIMIQELHELVTRGWLEDSGHYRTQNVRIAGAKKSPPNFSKVPVLIDKLFDQIKRMKTHTIIKASFFHHGFVQIHPFSDGNGRVARLLTNLLLMRDGYPPMVLRKDDRKKYYECLRKADGGNLRPLINFIGKAVDESLILYLAIFGGKNELLPLADLAKISIYTQEYLSLRARQGILDAVKLGKVWHSTRIALDEYIQEHGRSL